MLDARVFVGAIAFCTAGITTNGCVPSISGSGTPSASAASGFSITVNNVEGLKLGLVFYGIDNFGFAPIPWGQSSSFACVKPATQRMVTLNSGGTLNACNGVLSIDWNTYRATHPSALGSPFAAGDYVWAQGWFRDPPSPSSMMLLGWARDHARAVAGASSLGHPVSTGSCRRA